MVHLETVQHTLELKRELLRLLDACAEEDIEILPYKGVTIAESLYGNVALRQGWDLDVLVRLENFSRAARVIELMGYESEIDFDTSTSPKLPRKDCEVAFSHPRSGVVIELHWDFLPPVAGPAASAEFLWCSSEESDFEGRRMLSASSEAMLQMMLLHGGVKHEWTALRMLVDIARQLQRSPDLDVDSVLVEADKLGCEHTALVGLNLARLLLGVELSSDLIIRIDRATSIDASAALAMGRMFGDASGLPSYREWVGYLRACGRFEGKGGPSLRDIMRYIRAASAPEFADRFLLPPLPRSLGFVHYLVRPIRLVWGNGIRLLKRV